MLLALDGAALRRSSPAAPAGQAAREPQPAKPPAPKSPFTPPAFKITVATEGAYPPFNYLDRKGLPAGFEMELAQEACQRMKAECEFAAVKWDDLIPGLLDKKFDIIMSSLEVNSERRKRLGLSRRYYLSPGAFIAAKGAAVRRPALAAAQQADRRAEATPPTPTGLDKSFRRSAQIKRYTTRRRGAAGAGQGRGRRGVRRQGAALAVVRRSPRANAAR